MNYGLCSPRSCSENCVLADFPPPSPQDLHERFNKYGKEEYDF